MTGRLYKLMNWPRIEDIIYSECDNPHEILGPHKAGRQTLVQAFFPEAVNVCIIPEAPGKPVKMEMADEEGFFAAFLPDASYADYHYSVERKDGSKVIYGEPYRFKPLITQSDTDKFKNGIHYTIYEKLGAHPMEIDGTRGTYFAVWAPGVLRASVVGDFNGWDGRIHQMRRLWDSGIFEIFIPYAKEGENYKYEFKLRNGLTYLKADPYCSRAQLSPETASVIADLSGFSWEDEEFLEKRADYQTGNVPVSIYELYLGSFKKPKDGERYANYRDIADSLIPYVREMGYTHVELMPVMEHPRDESRGYQVIGYYAPTARYGSPEDFMYFVNELHKAGIGVILDWVPVHFPKDDYGLSGFDGTCLYGHLDPRQGLLPYWGTLAYRYGSPQVSNYLIANALYWVEKYHADGIRINAVANMLYLDYGKSEGGWIPNIYGGRENLEAIEFLKHLNSMLKKRNHGVLSIAEESTAFPLVTGGLNEGGLGFDLKWNNGFVNDYLRYIQYDPYFRSSHHAELTFSTIYAYSEKFILSFSHDEIADGRSSMLGKMPGDTDGRFANLRLTYSYMMTHPGKKLLFMGQDLGEPDEWNEKRTVEWELASEPRHAGIRELVKDLNGIYRTCPELYELDDIAEGFEWINNISANEGYLTFARHGKESDSILLVAANFSGVPLKITTGVPAYGKYKEIFNSDNEKYGGLGQINVRIKKAVKTECDDRQWSVKVSLAPLSLSILRFVPYTEDELKRMEEQTKKRTAKRVSS